MADTIECYNMGSEYGRGVFIIQNDSALVAQKKLRKYIDTAKRHTPTMSIHEMIVVTFKWSIYK